MLTAQSTERQLPTKHIRPEPQLNALSAEPNAHSSKLTAQSTERQLPTKNHTPKTPAQSSKLKAQSSKLKAQSSKHQLPTKTIRPKPQLNAQCSQPNAHSPMLTAQSANCQKNHTPETPAQRPKRRAQCSQLTAQSSKLKAHRLPLILLHRRA